MFVPRDLKQHFKEKFQDMCEGDYMIITSQTNVNDGKVQIIMEQLKQLELDIQCQVYNMPYPGSSDQKKEKVLISVKIPEKLIQNWAHKLKIETPLTLNQTQVFVKAPFNKNFSQKFNQFDSTGRIEIITEILKQEIDFDYYQQQGIIESHFPLHKAQTVEAIQASLDHFRFRLTLGFLNGSFIKYMEPLNMIKNYYGEKYAFEYAFLMHYQAWLLFPSIVGFLVFCGSAVEYFQTGSMKESLDSTGNGIFGLVCAIWATLFVESWKRKQTTIVYLWNCHDTSFSKYDERTEEFKYYEDYNFRTDSLLKVKKIMQPARQLMRSIMSYIFLLIVLIAMFFYQYLLKGVKGTFDEHGNLIVEPTFEEKLIGYTYTAIYSGIVIIFGTMYKKLAAIQTFNDNFQYQKSYDDALINRLFQFNFFNFYMPLLLVAFYTTNYNNLFIMMLSQMAFKQTSQNMVEYIIPILKTKKKLDNHQNDYMGMLTKLQVSGKDPNQTVGVNDSHTELVQDDVQIRDIRKFQAHRDEILLQDKPNVLDHYMELVVQFGFIVLFSSVFPLASLMSLISNRIQIGSQINNFTYTRRFTPEVSNGIGSFLSCLQILCQISIMVNSGIIYFTSKTIRLHFVQNDPDLEQDVDLLVSGWQIVNFLILVVVIEHAMLILKIFFEQVIDDIPDFVVQGKQERLVF